MKPAGEYIDRLEWLKRLPGSRSRDGFGQPTDPFESQGYLWAAIDQPTGGRTTEKDSEREQTTATIRIRNYPAVAAGDKLADDVHGETWKVLNVVRALNEILCEVER